MRGTAWIPALALTVVAAVLGACEHKTIPLPAVSTPRYPEYMQPVVPPQLANAAAAAVGQARGWRFFQAGDLRNAELEFELALKIMPGFYPANTALGFVELARKDPKAALVYFDRALEDDGRYVPAIVGRGQTLLALDREAEALYSFQSALAFDSSLSEIRQRVEVLKFRGLEQDLSAAREAARSGRLAEAARAYATAITSSPDSAFLYRELATVERDLRQTDASLANFRKATELDPTDAASLAQIGDILAGRDDLEAAAKAYGDALNLEANDAVEAKLEALRARAERARLPEEYRAIDVAAQITRGDLAALIGVRLGPLVQSARRRDAVVVTDVRNHWAATWIMAVVRAGIIEPFANHTFQPRIVVRRVDLAQAVGRILARIAAESPSRPQPWQSARLRFADLSTSHLAYLDASMAVAAAVMRTEADNAFQPSRPVGGAEAVQAIDRLEALAGQPAATPGR